MSRQIVIPVLVTLILAATTPQLAYAMSYQDKVDFASGLEEALGHFKALEQNLDEGNTTLAVTHATHPIAELYDAMKPVLRDSDPQLDALVYDTLMNLKDEASTDVPRAQAQQAIDDAKDVVEMARLTIIGDLSNDPVFKAALMRILLETSVAEYGEAVADGTIINPAEFQDGSAFVWQSQQILDTIRDDLDFGQIDLHYKDLWAAYDSKADPSEVEAITGEIINIIDEILGVDSQSKDLLDYVENIRSLLDEANHAYGNGDRDLALSLVTRAYLDNYEFLEFPLIQLGEEELMVEVEIMMREDLRNMIKNNASPSQVSAQIETILEKMDTIAVVVPEFGTIAMMILVIAIISLVAFSARSRLALRT